MDFVGLCEIVGKDIEDANAFYKCFSSLNVNSRDIENNIAKTWEYVQKNVLSKDILYLSLLANKNFKLLSKCIAWDKKSYKFNIQASPLYNYTIFFNDHWINELIRNVNLNVDSALEPTFCDKITLLRIIKHLNEPFTEKFNLKLIIDYVNALTSSNMGDFWTFIISEFVYILNNVAFCLSFSERNNESEILRFAAGTDLLKLCWKYTDLNKNYTIVEKHYSQVLASFGNAHENLKEQFVVLSHYNIISKFFKIIIPGDENLAGINVNEVINALHRQLGAVQEHSAQIELLEVMFATIFMKKSDKIGGNTADNGFLFNQKEIRLILHILKPVIEQLAMKRLFQAGTDEHRRLEALQDNVTAAFWRLGLMENLLSRSKCDNNLLKYMLADPESLINICLKQCDFKRASEVLQIFNMTDTSLYKDVRFAELLEELKSTLARNAKISSFSDSPAYQRKYDEIARQFLEKYAIVSTNSENDAIIESRLQQYPFLEPFTSDSFILLNVLDLAIAPSEYSRDLFRLAFEYGWTTQKQDPFSRFSTSLQVLVRDFGSSNNCPLEEALINSSISFDVDRLKRDEHFYGTLSTLYSDFHESLDRNGVGILNKNHPSHKLLLSVSEHCSTDHTKVKYLEKLFNYLKAFSKVLYIEADSSRLVSNDLDTSFFELLAYNRSELMGKLLFQRNLEPMEFERYFKKLKLDFLYHVTGNCFPTINLHVEDDLEDDELYPENILYAPNQAVIGYILKRNRLLALIVNEMYHVENVDIDVNETRIQNLLNYLRSPRIEHLKELFQGSEILTALQNDISYRKVREFVMDEMNRYDIAASTGTTHSFEAAGEIFEEGATTLWKRLSTLIDSVPERQLVKEKRFHELKDLLLTRLVKDAFECEFYKNVYNINDVKIRRDLILDNVKNWPVVFCINCIKHEVSSVNMIEDDTMRELKGWLRHLEHSKAIMDALEVSTWTELYHTSTFRPAFLVSRLLDTENVQLLIDHINLDEVNPKTLHCIDEAFLTRAFNLNVDKTTLRSLLDVLPFTHKVSVCRNLLDTLRKVIDLRFVVEYLSHQVQDGYLTNVRVSLRILEVFPDNENIQPLLPLLKTPISIIEVLIMNTKLDRLDAVLKAIRSVIPVSDFGGGAVSVEGVDELLRRYALKSLDFRVITQPAQKKGDYPLRCFTMPEEVPNKENWVQNSEVTECMCCITMPFSMFNRRHHCRRCGRVVCASCSKKRMIVPNYGDIMVRVCLDCYTQTFKDRSVKSDDNRSTWPLLEDFWMLTNDPEHNRILKEEFSYEFAPSVSLCLALMKFHSKNDTYSMFLIEQCEFLMKLIIPKDELTRELDYLLVIKMLKSLAVAVKMSYHEVGVNFGSSLIDTMLNQAALFELLAERGCLNLLPVSGESPMISAVSLRRLTDKLLEMEQWNLALEIATKAGLDNSGVFVAWGKSCLKAGCFMTAREKFTKCLDKNAYHETSYFDCTKTGLKVTKNPPLLNDIIKILEANNEPLSRDMVQAVEPTRYTGSTSTLNQSAISNFQTEGALFILNKIANLKYIEKGQYNVVRPEIDTFIAPRIDPIIYNECVYYLTKFGNVVTLVDFHLKYKQYRKALECIVEQKLNPDVFIHVYVKCLKDGTVDLLQTHMSTMDSSLQIWQDYLRKICLHLEKQSLLHSLYQLQQYMGDFIRAAMTCVRFYQQDATCFTDLLKNGVYLTKSEEHLKQALEQEQWVNVSTVEVSNSWMSFEEKSLTNPCLIKKMSQKEIEKSGDTIKLQNEVVRFLSRCENTGVLPMQIYADFYPNPDNIPKHKLSIPTLFGSSDDKKYVAMLCIVCGETIQDGFELAMTVMTEMKIRPAKVYNEAGKFLAQMEKFGSIAELVNNIRKMGGPGDKIVSETSDEMLIHAVATLAKVQASKANMEALIKLISSIPVKISAYIEAKQLKMAYFLATKYKRIVDLRRIMKEAEMLNQTDMRNLCQKAIKVHTQAASASTPPK